MIDDHLDLAQGAQTKTRLAFAMDMLLRLDITVGELAAPAEAA